MPETLIDRKVDLRGLPDNIHLQGGARMELGAEAAGGRRLDIVAYSGNAVTVLGSRLILDLAGVDIGRQDKPILRDHDPAKIAGHTDSVRIVGGKLRMRGVLSNATEWGREVANVADEGFPWQASVGVHMDRVEHLEDGDSKTVNGRRFAGPGMVVTKWRLREVSVLPLGADDETSVTMLSGSMNGLLNLAAGDPRTGIIDAAIAEFNADPSLAKITTARAMVNMRLREFGHARMPDTVLDAIGAPTDEPQAFARRPDRYGGNPTRTQLVGMAMVEFRDISPDLAKITSERSYVNLALHDMGFRKLTAEDVRSLGVSQKELVY